MSHRLWELSSCGLAFVFLAPPPALLCFGSWLALLLESGAELWEDGLPSVGCVLNSNALMRRVAPGVLDVKASRRWLARALMSDDLPTLDRPIRAISVAVVGMSSTHENDDANLN